MTYQQALPFSGAAHRPASRLKSQLLKWIGNKQRFADEIISCFPARFGTYFEPFLGSGAVLGSLAPTTAVASDAFRPLVEIWQALREAPEDLKRWYAERWNLSRTLSQEAAYEQVRADFNAQPNGRDLVYLCRACYGGVVRFRKADGYMSTPSGIHRPIASESFARRVDLWRHRCRGTQFLHCDYSEAMRSAKRGDLIYCDPPYVESQTILYGAQAFSIGQLLATIAECKSRGVFVALSIDGTKRSGERICDVPVPDGLFEHEALVNCGRSMLKRFQMAGQTLEAEVVADRLLLTYSPSADS